MIIRRLSFANPNCWPWELDSVDLAYGVGPNSVVFIR